MIPSKKTISAYLQELAKQEPDKKLLGNPAGWMTCSQVWSQTQSIALQLRSQGLRPGDVVALQTKRCLETVLVIFALRLLGTTVVLADPHHEPEQQLRDCETPIFPRGVLCFTRDNRLSLSMDAKTTFIRFIAEQSRGKLPLLGDAQSPGFVIFTSGSTGKQKAVVLCDYNVVNNLLDSHPLGCYSEDDIALGAIPLEHVFGLVLLAGTAVLRYAMYLPAATDVDAILGCIEQEKITRINGVPSLYQAMAARCGGFDVSSLRAGFIGGAPETTERLLRLEAQLGMTLVPVYGMSECIGISCADGREPAELRARGVGRVYPMNTVKLLGEDGNSVKPGEIGEITVYSPARMLGYWGSPMAPEAFLPTGDLGYLDANGILHICGRKKELIIRNGRNIAPKKIEDALLSLPGVYAAAVVGMPDELVGEVPYAMIVGVADPAELKKHLPKNELPVGILCAEELPMTASGKPDKLQIKEVLRKWKNG